MWTTTARLTSKSLYSQSRPHCVPRIEKETPDAYEARTWHHRLHVNDGQVYLPAMALRNCIAEAAKFLSIQIPGKGKSTYTKHFESGLLITSSPSLYSFDGKKIVPPSEKELSRVINSCPGKVSEQAEEYKPEENESYGDWVFVPSDGVPGSGKRVWKCYPMIQNWTCECEIQVVDDAITKDIFYKVLQEAGNLIGVGRFRVRNRGIYGRFNVEQVA